VYCIIVAVPPVGAAALRWRGAMTSSDFTIPEKPSAAGGAGGRWIDRRRFLGLTAAAGASLTLSACGVGGGDSGGGDAGGEGDGTGTINALFMKQAGYSEDDVRAMTDEFQKANPNIKVTPEFVAYEALHDKIVAAAPAGTYDVVLIDVIWPAEFAKKRIVADVSDRYPANWKQDMYGGALTTAEFEGKFYGVPWILDTKYLYVNKAQLDKAGVSIDQLGTWDGVVEAARALKSKGVVKYPLIWSWSQAEAIVCDYAQLLGAFGGSFLDAGGKPAFNTGGGVQALEFMQTTLKEGLTNPASTESLEEDVRKTFSNGDASMALNWTYMYGLANDPKESKVVGQVEIVQTPAGPSSKRPGVNGSMALSITTGTRKAAAAWKYIEYLTSQAVQNKYSKSSLPVWKAAYDDPSVQQTNPATVAAAKTQLNDLILRPTVASYNSISQQLQVELLKALANNGTGKPAQQALDDAAKAASESMSG
jgi:multiple sugar transport system substrate-binding protein